jgi:hypothetical protein
MPRLKPRLLTAFAASLLLVAAATTLAACGGGGTTTIIQTTVTEGTDSTSTDSTSTDTTTTDTTDTTTTDTTTDGATRSLMQFQTPSKNIGCVMFSGGVRCDAKNHQWNAGPAPSDCPLDYGDGIEVGGKGQAHFVCAGDTTLGAGPVLEYGETSEVKGASCTSAEDGVTCTSDSGPGFFISIQSYKFTG